MSDLVSFPPQPGVEGSRSLREQAVRGVFWVALSTVVVRLVMLATYVLLARLLAPKEFGVFAVATIAINALLIFNDLGLGAAIVQSKGDRETVASTAFFLMPLLGGAIAGLGAASAPITSKLLGDPGAAGVLRVLSVSIFFSSLAVVPSMLLEKDLAFRRKVLPDVLPVLAFAATAICLAAFMHSGAYSLAFAQLVESACLAFLTWMVCPWRPKWMFDTATARALLGYGKHVLGGGVIVYLATNMDNAFVSRTGGQSALGIYVLAYLVANVPATEIADVAGRVLFPSFVRLDGRPEDLRRAYARSLTVITVITFPLLAALIGLARPLVLVIFGKQWLGMVSPLTVLPGFAALRVVSGVTGNLFLATNRPRYILLTGAFALPLQAVLLWIFVDAGHGGPFGAAVAVTVAAGMTLWLIVLLVGRIMTISWGAVAIVATRLIVAASAGAAVGAAVARASLPPMATLAIGGASTICAYVAVLAAIGGRSEINDVVSVVRRQGARKAAKS